MEELILEIARGFFSWLGETFKLYIRLSYILLVFVLCAYRFEFSKVKEFYRDKENKKYNKSRFTLFVGFIAGVIFVTLDYLAIPSEIDKREVVRIMIISHIAYLISFLVLKIFYDYLLKFLMSGIIFRFISRRFRSEPTNID